VTILPIAVRLMAAAIFGVAATNSMAIPKWDVLFDGKSTAAWRGFRRQDFPSKCWAVEGGALRTIAGCDRSDGVDIITRNKYRDFEIELEWRVAPGANSGIMFLVTEDANATWMTGPEMQVLDDERHVDGKNAKTSAGALYGLIAPVNKRLRAVGEYNKVRITVRSGHVIYRLNAKKILEFDMEGEALDALIADSKFKNFPRFGKNHEGHIALQYHGDDVWYRNIRIRALSAK
jgi:hypothetical protein